MIAMPTSNHWCVLRETSRVLLGIIHLPEQPLNLPKPDFIAFRGTPSDRWPGGYTPPLVLKCVEETNLKLQPDGSIRRFYLVRQRDENFLGSVLGPDRFTPIKWSP